MIAKTIELSALEIDQVHAGVCLQLNRLRKSLEVWDESRMIARRAGKSTKVCDESIALHETRIAAIERVVSKLEERR